MSSGRSPAFSTEDGLPSSVDWSNRAWCEKNELPMSNEDIACWTWWHIDQINMWHSEYGLKITARYAREFITKHLSSPVTSVELDRFENYRLDIEHVISVKHDQLRSMHDELVEEFAMTHAIYAAAANGGTHRG